MLASIPSPPESTIELGPLDLRAYGLMIALGVVAGVLLAQHRWKQRGGDPDDIAVIAMWAVPAGLIGSRIYHVLTDWRFDEGWAEPFKIWEGGLGIPGGIFAGVLTAWWVMRRRGMPVAELIDVMVPSLPLAQAIGRLGNWFNQELYGGPSDLPWAVEIDPEHRPPEYLDVETFHPTFLYEALWNLALVVFLIWLDRKGVLRKGALLAVYVVGYLLIRAWLETVRIDPATEIAGVRINFWMSLIGIVLAGGWLLRYGRKPPDDEPATGEPASDDRTDEQFSDDTGGGVEEIEVAPPDEGAP
jgi:prolipoprotein diacylglyceryl transferase